MNSGKIVITHIQKEPDDKEKDLQARIKLPLINRSQLSATVADGWLYYSSHVLTFQIASKTGVGPLSVSFKNLEKRARDSLFNQNLIKALGFAKGDRPKVLDGTAGFGSDSFLIAYAGSKVSLFERNPIVYELLQDGLIRYASIGSKENLVVQRMQLHQKDFKKINRNECSPEVVYLDPMFPGSGKKALSKKPMYYLQKILTEDNDESCMLETALRIATKRVVVKRGAHTPELAKGKVDFVYRGHSNRFDVYLV